MPSSSIGRRVLYVLAWLAPLWALVAYATGGVGWFIGPIRISSRQPLRPFLIGVAIAGYYAWRYARAEREADARWIEASLARVGRFAIPVVVLLGFVIGVYYGSFAAAGSDSYGYLSQARLWLSGHLRIEQPWVQNFSWPNREWVFSPLGYRPVSADGTIVPTYPPGLPLLMAPFLGVFGDNGPFFVVPLLGALLLWLTYLLGKETTGSRVVGFLAAAMLLSSPVFLSHDMVPMSDVPAAAFWALVYLFAFRQRAVSAGLAAAAALVIRPNLIALVLAPVVIWRGRREPLLRYGLGVLPGVLFVAVLNGYLYGGPLVSGYGPFFESYAASAGPSNLRNYLMWLVQTQTPLILLAFVPLFVEGAISRDTDEVSPREGLAAVVILTLVSYLFYGVFNHWFYLRFLLPAYPAIFVLTAAAIVWLSSKLPVEARTPLVAIACGWIIVFGLKLGKDTGIFNQARFEQRHVHAALAVAAKTPPRSAILAVQHSGSVRYYADRVTVRYDSLPEEGLDSAIHELTTNGFQPYLVVDDSEEVEFRNRFGPHSRLGKLGWAPMARVSGSPEVRIYAMTE